MPHGTTKKPPREEHGIEQEFLHRWHPIILPEPEYPVHAVRQDNTISWESTLYSVPLDTYKGPGTEVRIKATADQITVLDKNRQELCKHVLSPLKGQKIILTDHCRDKRHAIAEFYTLV